MLLTGRVSRDCSNEILRFVPSHTQLKILFSDIGVFNFFPLIKFTYTRFPFQKQKLLLVKYRTRNNRSV